MKSAAKVMLLFVAGFLILLFLEGCGITANQKTLEHWSFFAGEEVTSVGETYPSGDVPRNLVKLKSGASRIY